MIFLAIGAIWMLILLDKNKPKQALLVALTTVVLFFPLKDLKQYTSQYNTERSATGKTGQNTAVDCEAVGFAAFEIQWMTNLGTGYTVIMDQQHRFPIPALKYHELVLYAEGHKYADPVSFQHQTVAACES